MAELFGVIKGLRAIRSEVCPGMLIGFRRNTKGGIELFQNLDGVVRGARIADTDGIGNLESRLNGPCNNTGFILNHVEHNHFNGVGHLFIDCWLGVV
jgi:hypothetical protein